MARALISGIFFGLLFVVLPFEILFLGAVLWIPALIYSSRKMGLRPTALFIAVFLAITVTITLGTPNRSNSQRYGPFTNKQATLRQLADAGAVFIPDGHDSDVIQLPSPTPTKLELLHAITNQTNFRCRLYPCTAGANLLFGPSTGPIRVKESKTRPQKSPP